MRYRLMATYRGVPYEAGIGPTDSDVVLFAACPPPEELGFEPATGHWRKQLGMDEVQALWESRPTGTFRGDRCIVLDDLGDRLHIAYLGHDAYRAEQLGYWQVDRGVFELIAPREEVCDVVEERVDYPRRAVTGPHGNSPLARCNGPAPTGSRPAGPFATGPHGTRPWATGPLAAGSLPTGLDGDAPRFPGADAKDQQAMAPTSEPPLPLEAAARLAASARGLQQASPASPAGLPASPLAEPAAPAASPASQPAEPEPEREPSRRERSALRRVATQRIFSELAGLAAIPPSAYAVGEEVDGAMCLIQTPDGFEVFNSAAGGRHEIRLFDDEESAYFYLFGVLAAEAVRTGRLAPQG